MKKGDFWSFAVNPFRRVAGWKAFGIGVALMTAAAIIGAQSQIIFSGALDIKYALPFSLQKSILCMAVGYLSLVVVLYLMALIFARRTRFQDIAGTIALARYPYLAAALVGFMVPDANLIGDFSDGEPMVTAVFWSGWQSVAGIAAIALIIVIAIYSIALLYNAYRESTGLKGARCTVTFITGVLIAEVLSIFALMRLS